MKISKPKNKVSRILLGIVALLVLVQIPWLLAVNAKVNRELTKTTATVIRVDQYDNNCPIRVDTTSMTNSYDICDRSYVLVSVYEYYDAQGNRYEHADSYLGEMKQNNPLRAIFGKDVGDTAKAYYTNSNPEEVTIIAGPFAYAAWLAPLYLAFFIVFWWTIIWLIIKIFRTLKQQKS